MTLRIALVFLSAVLAASAWAQEARFAVAAIKPTPADKIGVGISTSDDGRISMFGVTVQALAAQAYDVQNFQVSGGPNWASSDRWSIDAVGESGTRMTNEQRRQALRHLLEDRFGARLRLREDEVSGYELVVGEKGHRLKAAANTGKGTGTTSGPGMMNGRNITLAVLAQRMSTLLDRPVVDATGIAGNYDVNLTWKPEFGEMGFGAPGVPQGGQTDRSVSTAVEEELGLRLVSKKVRVPVVRIEAVELPGEN